MAQGVLAGVNCPHPHPQKIKKKSVISFCQIIYVDTDFFPLINMDEVQEILGNFPSYYFYYIYFEIVSIYSKVESIKTFLAY